MDSIKLLQWNCRSITANLDHLQQYLCENLFHVLCLQSLNCHFSKLPKVDGYYFPPIVNKQADNRKVYTATYVHTSLSYDLINPPAALPKTVHMSSINLKAGKQNICLLNCYIPVTPKPDDVTWLSAVDCSKPTLLVGDFNSRHPLWDKSAEEMNISQKTSERELYLNEIT